MLRIEEGWLSFFGKRAFCCHCACWKHANSESIEPKSRAFGEIFFYISLFLGMTLCPPKCEIIPTSILPSKETISHCLVNDFLVKDWLSQWYRTVYRTMHPMPIPWIVFITHCNQFVSSREESRCGTNRLFDTTSPRVILLPSSRAIHGQTFDWYWVQDITASASMIGKPIYLDKAMPMPSTEWQEWEMGGRIVRVHAVEFMLSQASFLDTK